MATSVAAVLVQAAQEVPTTSSSPLGPLHTTQPTVTGGHGRCS